MINLTINLRGQPLQRTYVSHFDFFRIPQTLFFRTDGNGRVTISNAGATATADPGGPRGTVQVSVYAKNSVVRVLDGSFPLGSEIIQRFNVSDGDTININTNAEQQDHFRIMDRCRDVYETVFRPFPPFSGRARRAFPFGKGATVEETRNRLPRIELRYAENDIYAPSLAWVEPFGTPTTHPVMHIKDRTRDGRLFGDGGSDPSLIPHELAHAVHFAMLPANVRLAAEATYAGWLASRIAAGQPPFHNTSLATSPFVGFVEALGIFSERFFFFRKTVQPGLTGRALQDAFIADELSANPSLGTGVTALSSYVQVGAIQQAGLRLGVPIGGLRPTGPGQPAIQPSLTGDDVEGAVYGAIFLDYGRRVGLSRAVNHTLCSNALSFDDFRNWVIRNTGADQDIIAVANTWGM